MYLGGDTSLSCSAETAARIDSEVMAIISNAHEQATALLQADDALLHELAAHLLEKETITGEEFMTILRQHDAPAQEAPIPEEQAPVITED